MTGMDGNDSGLGRRGALLLAAALAAVSLAVAAAPGGERAGSRRTSSELKIYSVERKGYVMTERVKKSDAEWRASLTSEQYRVLRESGTERAFTGALWNNHEKGVYRCAACGIDLFASETKFESGTGWPSFYAPVAKENVALHEDGSMMMKRTEAVCARCESHLGHVFDDGPKPTGLRYCINSAALSFAKKS